MKQKAPWAQGNRGQDGRYAAARARHAQKGRLPPKGSRVSIFDAKDNGWHLGTVVDIKEGRDSQHMLHIRWKQFGSGWFPSGSLNLKEFGKKRSKTHGYPITGVLDTF